MKTVITGGAGFIGTHLAERLVAAGTDVFLFDNYRRNSLKSALALRTNPNVTVIEGDVLDGDSLDRAVAGADTVVHLAAIAGVSSYYAEPLRTLQVNILGTVNVLEAAVRHKVTHFIDFSTSEVFGADALWVTEESNHGIGPVSDRRWVYATSKLASEQFSLRFGEQYGFACTCVRPFNIYGPRQTGEGAISNFCRAALGGEPLQVYGDGTPIRAWCNVMDLVDAVELILAKRATAAGQTFNIGNPREIESSLGLARRIARLVPGARVEMREVDRSEVRARVPNIDKARTLLGYEPRVELEDGLKQTLAWFQETVV